MQQRRRKRKPFMNIQRNWDKPYRGHFAAASDPDREEREAARRRRRVHGSFGVTNYVDPENVRSDHFHPEVMMSDARKLIDDLHEEAIREDEDRAILSDWSAGFGLDDFGFEEAELAALAAWFRAAQLAQNRRTVRHAAVVREARLRLD